MLNLAVADDELDYACHGCGYVPKYCECAGAAEDALRVGRARLERVELVERARKRGAPVSDVITYPYPNQHEIECAAFATSDDCTCPASWPGGWLYERQFG